VRSGVPGAYESTGSFIGAGTLKYALDIKPPPFDDIFILSF